MGPLTAASLAFSASGFLGGGPTRPELRLLGVPHAALTRIALGPGREPAYWRAQWDVGGWVPQEVLPKATALTHEQISGSPQLAPAYAFGRTAYETGELRPAIVAAREVKENPDMIGGILGGVAKFSASAVQAAGSVLRQVPTVAESLKPVADIAGTIYGIQAQRKAMDIQAKQIDAQTELAREQIRANQALAAYTANANAVAARSFLPSVAERYTNDPGGEVGGGRGDIFGGQGMILVAAAIVVVAVLAKG